MYDSFDSQMPDNTVDLDDILDILSEESSSFDNQ